MIEGHRICNFVTTKHFCERWYERTSIPGTYLDLVIQEGAYVFIGHWNENDYYMFSCPKDNSYFVFIASDNALKTILTEKMYKNYPNVDLRRSKKHLRQINKQLRLKWSTFKLIVNDYVVHNIKVEELADDPIWWHINHYNEIFEFWDKHTSTPKISEMYCKDFNIPLRNVFKYELYIGDECLFIKEITLSPFTFKKMKEYRECFIDTSVPMNRSQKRLLKKMKVPVNANPQK